MKRIWFFGLFLLGLAACGTATTPDPVPEKETSEPAPTHASLPDPSASSRPSLGLAPELTNEVWMNVDAPLRLADLRGRVVALEMWNFG